MRGSKANCFFVFSFYAISLHLCSLRSAGQLLYIINWATQHFPFYIPAHDSRLDTNR